MVATIASGLAPFTGGELLTMALYLPCCAGFAMVLRSIFPRNEWLGAILTVLTVLMIGICPVFFDLKMVPFLQFLLPPTYYIRGLYDSVYWIYAGIFIAACALLILPRVLKRR